MSYDAVLFDLDGTLLEPTDPDVLETAAHTTFEQCGVADPHEDHVETVLAGVTPADVDRIADAYDLSPTTFWDRREANASLAQRVQARLGQKTPYGDVDVLDDLECPLGIVTTNQHSTAEFLLDRFGLADAFATVHGREPTVDSLRRKKPDPHYLERALSDLAVDEAIYVGDSGSDLLGASNAGMDSALVERPHVDDPGPDPTYRIEGLAGLPALL